MYIRSALLAILLSSLLLSACDGGSNSSRRSGSVVVNPVPEPPPVTDPEPEEPPPEEPPPEEPPPQDPSTDYTMPALVEVLAPEADFEPACTADMPGNPAAPPVSGDLTGAESGVLVDAVVSGVAYRTGSIEGVTDRQGIFHFRDGETVHFSLGDTALGSVSGSEQVTPFDLAGSNIPVGTDAIIAALENDDHPFQVVINTAVLLQSLDGDADPTNGIDIIPQTAALLDGVQLELRQSQDDFANEYLLASTLNAANSKGLFGTPHVTVQPARALDHLYSTLGIEAHIVAIGLEEADWDGDGIANDRTRYQYDADGNLVAVLSRHDGDWDQSEEYWTYDARGKLTAHELREVGEQYSETAVYLDSGELYKREVDSDDNGLIDSIQTWSYKYYANGRLRQATMIHEEISEDVPSSAVAHFQYNSAGDISRVAMEGDGLHLIAEQLGLPLIAYIEYGKTYVISYEYDSDGRLVADTLDGQNPELGYHIVTRRFDDRGNVTYSQGRFRQGSDNEEQITVTEYRYEYDANGNITRSWERRDEDGRDEVAFSYQYDADHRLIREENDWDGNGKADEIAYHSYDQHDARVRTEWDSDADGSIDRVSRWPYTYEYDSSGRIVRRTLEIDGETLEVIGFSWHANGRLAQEDAWVREVTVIETSTWQYDDVGRLLQEQTDYDPDGVADKITRYSYDACGGLVSREVSGRDYNLPSEQAWQYDAAGRLRQLEWANADVVPEIVDSPVLPGFPLFPSTGFERWQYDAGNRPLRYQFKCEDECLAIGDGWDISLIELYDQTVNWEYDASGRVTRELVDENGDGVAERVTVIEYDTAGNVSRELVDTSASGTPDEVTSYYYDKHGNLLRREVDENGNGAADLADVTEYDSHGNVTASYSELYNLGTIENVSRYTNVYDALGNRIREETDRDGSGTVDEVSEWTYDANGTLLSRRREVLDANPPGSIEVWHYNSTGKVVRREYDDDGNGVPDQVSTYDYDAHGNLLKEYTGYSFDGDNVMEEWETREYVPTGWGQLFADPG